MGAGMSFVRAKVRRHVGIAPTACSDSFTTLCCFTCAACQLDQELDALRAEGVDVSSTVPQ